MSSSPFRLRRRLASAWTFTVTVLQRFRANQGLLLSGAVAYYALLSIVPLFILLLLGLSQIADQERLLATLSDYLKLVVPAHSETLVAQVALFLEHPELAGWLVGLALLFFSSVAFTVLENAMAVIFAHRTTVQRRHFLISAIIPYLYILTLGVGFLLMTLVATALQTLGDADWALLGLDLPLSGLAQALLYLLGLTGQILILASIYMVMPVGRPSWRRALLGGLAAGLVWEAARLALVWYFSTLSLVSVVYGSLASVVVVLLSFEVAALVLLLGAQVIAEQERRDLLEQQT
jgi:YihY family inner membrane protein